MQMNEKKFDIPKERETELIKAIQVFFLEDLDQDIGQLKAMLTLDFFIEKMAPVIYNQGIEDSYAYLSDKLEDLFGLEK